MTIGILGGGLSGLTLGHLLSKKGVEFEILEENEGCGGLLRSLREEGFTFDYGGSHIIFSKNDTTLRFMQRLLGDNIVRGKRRAKILYKGRLVKYPFENGLADLSIDENLECLSGFISNLLYREKGAANTPKNLRDWCIYRYGRAIADKYLLPYNRKIWKYPPEKLGVDWVERIPYAPLVDVLKSSLGISTEGYVHQLNFTYPKRGGISSLAKALELPIKERIRTNFRVKRIRKHGTCWRVSDGDQELEYDKLVSTIPIPELAQIVNAPKAIVESAKSLKHNSLATVMLGLKKPLCHDLSWLYVPDKSVLPHRISFPSNMSPYAGPRGKSSVLAEITFRKPDAIFSMSDLELSERTIDDLHKLSIVDKGDICFAKVARIPYAYLINDLGYLKNLAKVREYFQKNGIQLIGRFGEFRYLNMDQCVDDVVARLPSIVRWANE